MVIRIPKEFKCNWIEVVMCPDVTRVYPILNVILASEVSLLLVKAMVILFYFSQEDHMISNHCSHGTLSNGSYTIFQFEKKINKN